MKMRNKGKIHPFISSSSSSSSSSSTSNRDSLSVLKLLPAAILTLVSVLSLEDREVLAYMITRSLKSTNPSFFPASDDKKKSSKNKKQCFDGHGHGHKPPPLFDCDCFLCYTSFWVRWDSSPNRELIHQAIEAFEEHLNNGEMFKKGAGNGKNRRKEKMGRRRNERMSSDGGGGDEAAAAGVVQLPAVESLENQESIVVGPPEMSEVAAEELRDAEPEIEEMAAAAAPVVVVRNHKGLARKVLPDVMGLFSSRLWSLWSPNV